MEAKQQLVRMVAIQRLAREVREANDVVERAPERIEEIESRFRERNAEYVALRERFEALEKEQRARNAELETLEESRKKYMQDLMQVSNQREYAAMLKEIDNVKRSIAGHEEFILNAMEELEKLKPQLDEHADHIQQERKRVEDERGNVERAVEEAKETIQRNTEERSRLESELPSDLVSAISRVEALRQGLFLVKADDGTCQACWVRVRPQVFQEIRLASAIHHCSSCGRFLFVESSLEPSSDETVARPPASQGEGGVEASDGNAV